MAKENLTKCTLTYNTYVRKTLVTLAHISLARASHTATVTLKVGGGAALCHLIPGRKI